MKSPALSLLLLFLLGCVPMPRIESAPRGAVMDAGHMRETHSRVLAVPRSAVFPRVLDLLLDQGYQVRSANEPLGFVAFHQQWVDRRQATKPILSLEGTLLFREEGTSRTRVRVEMTGRWEVMSIGETPSMVSEVVQTVDPQEYRKVLDFLEQGLR
ncbi:MAG: hypothetical protein U0P81_13310 [Holophagaceae bacterium]